MERDHGSETTTQGIRVSVHPEYVPAHSNPEDRKFVFEYRIRITNMDERAATLRARHWIIVDADGDRTEVEGEGVVGQQPRIEPGGTFEYASYCPLTRPWGTMEGWYVMEREDGERFNAAIGRFYLVVSGETSAAE